MSQGNSTGARRAESLGKFRGLAGRISAHAVALMALGIACLVEEPTATVACAVAAALGGLLLIRAVAVRRGGQEPCRSVVELKRVRVHPLRHR